ncbi:energy-coupling factor ABC transporter ATP-binding protein [Clostridium kluyveri]|uniref:Cobalt ABC transporter ATP-binding protein n=1 Tax=Clostridium kluyveri TaxID=1534 RepID=A0A1L5F5T6_CLOKL|nr:ABC transporter ATP-binding protein [Clostridium kluyveri]APM38200.1 cobalt ABC transporter ATP-binding protein [Clostridium kluyveri]UZQ51788.1 energy-coupling factor ABC transporter ATP-binding protein [Clostridium kluyveri]
MSHIHIELKDVSFAYEKGQTVLSHITMEAGEHNSIGLIGANGMGKSTLLRLLVGLNLNYEGSISIEGIPVNQRMLARVREKIGYVFQDSDNQLFMPTVYDELAFAPRNYGFLQEEVEYRVNRALEMTESVHLKDRQIYKLSGGEKKLISIASVLTVTPDIILMDEPSIALDPKNRRNLIRILNQFEHLKIIASHDLDMILETCNRVILLDGGRIVCDGKTKDILYDKKLLEEHNLELPLSIAKDK